MIYRILKILFLFVILFCAFIFFQYAYSPVDRFPEDRPFTGNLWYNPYENLKDSWLKANFHAHSKSWLGMTHGNRSPDFVRADAVWHDFGEDLVFAHPAGDELVVLGAEVENEDAGHQRTRMKAQG